MSDILYAEFTDDETKEIAALIRAGATRDAIVRKLYEGKPSYGEGSALEGKENILSLLLDKSVPVDGVLAHAYERGFYFSLLMLSLIVIEKKYRMATEEAMASLGSVRFGAPR